MQVAKAVTLLQEQFGLNEGLPGGQKMLVTGGGARNDFLVNRLKEILSKYFITVETPADDLVDFKEAIIMGLIGVLRWREENNTLASVTGAARDSIGGAVWIGQEA
jgi:anhydro-N-acetylmuramic acid kinase